MVFALAAGAVQGVARAGDDAAEMRVFGRSICRVEVDKGPWLYVVTDGEGGKLARGWAPAEKVRTLDQAIREETAKIAARPDPARYYDRGRFWQARGEFDIAIADFDEVLRADTRCARAYYHRGCSWTDKGALANDGADIRRGLADLDSAIRLDPASVAFYCERGSAWVKLGKIYAGELNDAQRDLDRFEEWLRLTREYEDAQRKSEAFESSGGRVDPGAPKAAPDEPSEERRARELTANLTRREYLKVIKYARIETGAAFRNASDNFDAAIRLDPNDPRGPDRRAQVRAFLATDAGLVSARQ